ncbi:MAG: ABC transporter substrate-binding protein [Sphaerobacter sp.]|nr:ABC transporter substrate-binding protein [Sphaerobacter sp.]
MRWGQRGQPDYLGWGPARCRGTAPAGETRQGGTLTYVTAEEPETLNPYLTQLVVGFDILSLFMESLLEADDQGQYGPRLAESYEAAADGLTYTFTLRTGVKWHDGSDFTAQDVVESYNMIMNPDFGAFSQQGWDKITGAETPDDHTVVFSLDQVYAPFIANVGGAYIAPASALAKGIQSFKEEFGREPFGTGPFRFVEWASGDHITAQANADYWQGAPKLEQIVCKFVPNSNTIAVQLKSGEADLAAYVDAQQFDTYQAIEDKQVIETDSQAWFHLDLKNIDFLMEKPVRQALDFATPKQDIIDKILKGHATISVADVAPISWAYNPNIKPRPYDLEQAKKLLDEAGWTPGPDGIRQKDGKRMQLELWGIAGDQQNQQILQVIAASWKQIGVQADLKFQDIKTLWGPEGYQFTETPTACGYSWFNGNDPDDSFYWHSSQIPDSPTGSGGNLPAYFHPYDMQDQIDELTERGVATIDQEERKKIYWQIQELLHEYVPVIFIYWNKLIFVSPKRLQGFKPNAFTPLFHNVHEWAYRA